MSWQGGDGEKVGRPTEWRFSPDPRPARTTFSSNYSFCLPSAQAPAQSSQSSSPPPSSSRAVEQCAEQCSNIDIPPFLLLAASSSLRPSRPRRRPTTCCFRETRCAQRETPGRLPPAATLSVSSSLVARGVIEPRHPDSPSPSRHLFPPLHSYSLLRLSPLLSTPSPSLHSACKDGDLRGPPLSSLSSPPQAANNRNSSRASPLYSYHHHIGSYALALIHSNCALSTRCISTQSSTLATTLRQS